MAKGTAEIPGRDADTKIIRYLESLNYALVLFACLTLSDEQIQELAEKIKDVPEFSAFFDPRKKV